MEMLAKTLLGVALAGLLLQRPVLGASANTMPFEEHAFFVAIDGNDTNPGTREEPWRTIQHAVDQAQPGVTIYVRGGVYEESVRIDRGGAAGEYVALENYPGERPVIDPAFKSGCGVLVTADYVRIKGLEIRNCKADPERRAETGGLGFAVANHCVAEGNTVHHVIGAQGEHHGKPAIGISVQDSDSVIIQNNTVYDVVGHCESMGIKADTVSNMVIRRNLVYFCDKEGIRLLTYDRDSDNVIEGNIALSNNIGIAVNNCRPKTGTTIVRNNFSGWNCTVGMQIKHSTNTVVTHNTIYGNHGLGLKFNDRPFNYYAVVKNNILSNNVSAWQIVDNENFHETVDYDFYQYQPGSLLAEFDWSEADRCYSLLDIQRNTERTDTVGKTYEQHGREGAALFVDPAGTDFRLQAESPARGGADDGKEMGALESELVEAGAEKAYSLARIPDLGELRLRVESFSSESERGRAANVADQSGDTYWEVDTSKDSKREIVLALTGEKPHELTFITLTKPEPRDNYYRQFRLYLDDGSGQWNLVPEPAEHPFVGYTSPQGINNGETWALPKGMLARRLKVELVSGYSDIIRIPEIRVYGSKTAAGEDN